MRPLTFRGFFVRWAIASTLLLATYNPTAWCYLEWAIEPNASRPSTKILVGIVLLVAFSFYWHSCKIALGKWGIRLVALVFVVGLWQLADLGWLDPASPLVLQWATLLLISTLMTLGMSWSHLQRRITGQFDVEMED